MSLTLTEKIIQSHLLEGEMIPGEEITIKLNQTLTQDSTGTMVYLQLVEIDPDEIKTDFSIAYIDHNTIQAGFENADDHAFIRSVCRHYGISFMKPGGGICHQVHLEQFSKPGITLIGSDSHTPTAGGIGALGMGAGGLDVALGMAQGQYTLNMPKVFGVELVGKPNDTINGKDIVLEVLRRLTVKGGVGFVMEYFGDGLKYLNVPTRATITNMGAELGATSSIFPSDEITKDYLERQNRVEDYIPLSADEGAEYDETIVVDLSQIVPMTALPHMPDNVKAVADVEDVKVDQVAIGSCTNSSFSDLMRAARILEGKRIHEDLDLVISPGSAQVLKLIAENGALNTFVMAGARILEAACGPCIGMGQAPRSGGVSLRTFNRNFLGRSGTLDAEVYLVSPETAAASAITGKLTDPSTLDVDLNIEMPEKFGDTKEYILDIQKGDKSVEIEMGPNIKPVPVSKPLEDSFEVKLLLKAGDNVTTDDIAPSNARLLPLRSNIPALSEHTFATLTDNFKERALAAGPIAVVGGNNYGQGSSREHAALQPLFLGVKFVLAESFARIHRTNLINVGLLPLVFKNPSDSEKLEEGQTLALKNIHDGINGNGELTLEIVDTGKKIPVIFEGSAGEKEILMAGGKLLMAKEDK